MSLAFLPGFKNGSLGRKEKIIEKGCCQFLDILITTDMQSKVGDC